MDKDEASAQDARTLREAGHRLPLSVSGREAGHRLPSRTLGGPTRAFVYPNNSSTDIMWDSTAGSPEAGAYETEIGEGPGFHASPHWPLGGGDPEWRATAYRDPCPASNQASGTPLLDADDWHVHTRTTTTSTTGSTDGSPTPTASRPKTQLRPAVLLNSGAVGDATRGAREASRH